MIMFMFILSSFSCFLVNPLSMGVLLLLYSFFVCLFVAKIMLSSWFCIIIMLVMIGGLLVIFMYISSISSNEKFKLKFKFYLFLFFLGVLGLDEFLFDFHCFDYINMINFMNLSDLFSMVSFYDVSCFSLTFFLVIYLIFTMVVVSNIMKHYMGPLRSFSYEKVFS
uniref:NADH dehydrogenase subunit 6 n=1 Tax=Ledropsis sp. TaxID=3133679 RepID=A0AAU6PC39_9HEMI